MVISQTLLVGGSSGVKTLTRAAPVISIATSKRLYIKFKANVIIATSACRPSQPVFTTSSILVVHSQSTSSSDSAATDSIGNYDHSRSSVRTSINIPVKCISP